MSDEATPTSESARTDLDFVRRLVARTERRIDPHAFHFVHWGLIVLVWYPLANLFERQGRYEWLTAVCIAAPALGILLSVVREIRLGKNPRLPGEDTLISTQVGWITGGCITAGVVLSTALPALQAIEPRDTSVVWGFVYANLAFMVGVVYRREFLWSGIVIFAASIAAVAVRDYDGFILGPAMGLGLAVPGWMAERRVRRLREEDGDPA
jgi:hypothetical protein